MRKTEFFARYSLGTQLAAVFVLVYSIGVLVLSVTGYYREIAGLEAAELRGIEALSKGIRHAVAEDIYSGDYIRIERTLTGLGGIQDLDRITVYGSDGLILSEVQRDTDGGLRPTFRFGQAEPAMAGEYFGFPDDTHVRVRVPVHFANELIAWLEFTASTATLSAHELGALLQNLVFSSILLVVVSIAIGLFLRYGLRPLRELAEFSRRLPSTDGDQIASIPRARELDELTVALNRASQEISRQHRALLDNNILLEQRVAHRTVELERARDAADEARAVAEHASRAKSDFLASMSHELRTPLNAIIGFTQLLEMQSDSLTDQDRAGFLLEIRRSSRHLLNLVNQVLDLARIDSSHLNLEPRPVELRQLVDECIHLANAAHNMDEQVSISAAQIKSGLQVLADPTCLRQVMINLLSNAVKYNRPGGTVTVSAEATNQGRIRIAVADTGRGIAAENLARIFDPFERLSFSKGNIGGTGIGLTVTLRLVEAMKGTISVDSTVDSGSVFTVELASAGQVETDKMSGA